MRTSLCRRARLHDDDHLVCDPQGNGYQATVAFSHGVSISSAETYPSIGEAVAAAAMKVLDMPERLEALDREASISGMIEDNSPGA